MSEKKTHQGGCHCGAIRYEAVLDVSRGGRCNCSICLKSSVTGALVSHTGGRDNAAPGCVAAWTSRSFWIDQSVMVVKNIEG